MNNILFYLINNIRVVLVLYIVSLLTMSFLFVVYEHVPFLDALYWASCTSLTIGYGDFSPHTNVMKFLTIFASHFWALVIIPAVIVQFFKKYVEDRDAFTNEEQEQLKTDIKTILNKIEKGL